jgi:membrane protein
MPSSKFSENIVVRFATSIWRTLVYYVRGLYNRILEENIVMMASGIAFNGLLCLIPLLLLLTWILGTVLAGSDVATIRVNEILDTIFPPQPYAQEIKSTIQQMIGDIVRYRASFGILGALVLVWTSASLVSIVRTMMNKIYRIPGAKFALENVLRNVAWVLIVGLLFVASNVFLWMLSLVDSLLQSVPALKHFHVDVRAYVLPFEAMFFPVLVMFFIINKFIPDRRVSTGAALLAALTTTILWIVAGKAFGWYLSEFHSYSRLYGTYAFILVFLIWIYYTSLVFVIGVIMGQLHRERKLQAQA